jgi:hypothetical protein
MAVGDILKEQNLVVEYFSVKSGEDIEKGEIVIVDSGVEAAASGVKGPYYMAMQAYDHTATYTDPIRAAGKLGCVKQGYVEAQLKDNSGTLEKGDYLELSSTAGELQYSDVSSEYEVVGVCEEAVTDTTQCTVKMTIGQAP